MFQENVNYETVERDRLYRIEKEYKHSWLVNGRPSSSIALPHDVKNRLGDIVATFTRHGITLLPGYEWNGSNVIPDSPHCMRASAIHDAWCQAMRSGIYDDTEDNWDLGAQEYARICRADGMNKYIAWTLRKAIEAAGEVKYPG